MKSSLSGTIKTFSVKESFVHFNYTEGLFLFPSVKNYFPSSSKRKNISRYLIFLLKSYRLSL